MSRLLSAILLIALGLGIGLWIGLNPQSRAAAEESVQRANETFVQVQADITAWWNQVRPDAGGSQSSAPSARSVASAPESQTATPADLWAAAKQVWLNFLTRLRQEM